MLKSYFQVFAYNKDQSYLRQLRKRRSRSFVQGFLKSHFRLCESSTTINITDVLGTNAAVTSGALSPILRATGGGRGGGNFRGFDTVGTATGGTTSTSLGIVVGTGTTSVTAQDYQLATLIADGVTSGTLEYFPSSGTGLTVSNPNGSFTLERLFRNSSSGSITINEVGVFAHAYNSTIGNYPAVCIIRDLVSPGFTIANGEYMRIIYTLSVTV